MHWSIHDTINSWICSFDPVLCCAASPEGKLSSLLFARNAECLLLGDTCGQVGVWQLHNLPVPSAHQVRLCSQGSFSSFPLGNAHCNRWGHNSSTRVKTKVVGPAVLLPHRWKLIFLYKQEKCLHAENMTAWMQPKLACQKVLFSSVNRIPKKNQLFFPSCFPGCFFFWHCCSCWSCSTVADIPSPSGNPCCGMNINCLSFFSQ